MAYNGLKTVSTMALENLEKYFATLRCKILEKKMVFADRNWYTNRRSAQKHIKFIVKSQLIF